MAATPTESAGSTAASTPVSNDGTSIEPMTEVHNKPIIQHIHYILYYILYVISFCLSMFKSCIYLILHTIYNVKCNGYVGWLVCYGTSVIGSLEVPSFDAGDEAVGDTADAVGVPVIGDDADEIDIDCDCDIGDGCDAGFVLCI